MSSSSSPYLSRPAYRTRVRSSASQVQRPVPRLRKTGSLSFNGANLKPARISELLVSEDLTSPEWDASSGNSRYHRDAEATAPMWADVEQALRVQMRRNRRQSGTDTSTSLHSTPSLVESSSRDPSPHSSGSSTPATPVIGHHFPSTDSFCNESPSASAIAFYGAATSPGLPDDIRDWRATMSRSSSFISLTTPARPSRSRSSLLLQSLTKSVSRRGSVRSSTSSASSPTKRLAPLSRYNPFIRARSESLSSVIGEGRSRMATVTDLDDEEFDRPRRKSSPSITPNSNLRGHGESLRLEVHSCDLLSKFC